MPEAAVAEFLGSALAAWNRLGEGAATDAALDAAAFCLNLPPRIDAAMAAFIPASDSGAAVEPGHPCVVER
jgi:hypothetical protein